MRYKIILDIDTDAPRGDVERFYIEAMESKHEIVDGFDKPYDMDILSVQIDGPFIDS